MSDSEEDRQTVTLWVPQISDSLHISVDHLKSELKLVEQGRKDGQKLLPPHNQHTLNEIQLEICSRIFRGIRQLNDFLSKEVAAVAKRARAIVPVRPTIQDLKEQVGGAIEKVFIEHGDELRKTRADFLQTQRDLKAFRANNGLIQKAYYNESSVMVAATILAMFVAESVLNGTLFADVVSTGLIGGAGLAGTISAANIGFGVFAGLVGWRLAHHVSQKKRIIGYLVILIIHPAVIAGNFFVAHLREAAEALASQSNYDFNPATLGSAAMAHIHEHGFFGITSIQSLGLLAMGILIHLYAAKEGWNDIADRYWDYKTQDLRCRHAEERFQDSVEDLRIAAREAVDYIEDDAKETIKAAQAAYQKIAECLDQVTQRQQEIKSSEDQWVAGGNLLLTAYREANREIRDAMSVPPYFDRFPTPADYRYKTYNGGPSDTEIDRFRDAVEHSLAEIRDLKQRAKEAETWSEEVLRSVSRLVTKSIKGIEERIDREVLNVKTPEFDGPSADFASYEDEPAGEAPGNATA